MPQKTQKKENLPVKVDVDLQNGGTISYANEVIATIAGVAANEIDGVAGMCVSGGISEMLTRNKNITKGVKVEVGSQEAAVDLYVIVDYGKPIQKVSAEVQENVRRALESLTGLHVVRVDVHVQGVSFEKEKKAVQTGLEASKNPVLSAPETEAQPAPKQKKIPAAKKESVKADPAPAKDAAGPSSAPAPADELKQDDQLADQDAFDDTVLREQAQLEGGAAAESRTEEAAPAETDAPQEPKTKKPVPDKKPNGRLRA
ncbi:MAG: Asp23/Gls24 family envelope stress response protein [Clostridia bacterium]|nr:Asp23/Gls24 family envelope stress response protein [Clostridia bacterium]